MNFLHIAIQFLNVISIDKSEVEPLIGWCCFYPGQTDGMDVISQSGATGLSVCAGGLGVEKSEGVFDFSTLEKQITFAEENGLKLALIEEINPLFAPKWMRDKMRESGQAIKGYGDSEDTRDGGIPSIQSELFRDIQKEIIRQKIEFINKRDKNRVITHIHPGAEWWFLPGYRYSHLDISDFRNWLEKKYLTIDKLNTRWESEYKSFNEVPAPAIDFISKDKYHFQSAVWVNDGGLDCRYSTELKADVPEGELFSSPVVVPGKTYTFSAYVKCDNLSAQGISCDFAWVDEHTGKPIYGGSANGAPVFGTADWQKISLTATAPNGAGWVQLILRSAGAGSVKISRISLTESDNNSEMAPNPDFANGDKLPGDWIFSNAPTTRNISKKYEKSGGYNDLPYIEIFAEHSGASALSFKNEHAASYDWASYWYETAAEYINYCSGLFKSMDPSRIISTYLTFAFAHPAEWDYTQWTAISPDEVAIKGSNIDEIGLQICAADKDPYRITASLDLIRKYGKPMWAVDLIDFTSGVSIGYEWLDKITQATIQHGAKGIIYCSWSIGSVPDYSYFPHVPTEKLDAMLTDAAKSRSLIDGMSIKTDIALIQPILPSSPADKDGYKNDFHSFIGWYKILDSMQLSFDVITLNELEKEYDLMKYKMVVIPECKYIQPKAKEQIDKYIDGEGAFIICDDFALFDEIGHAYEEKIDIMTSFDYGKIYCGTLLRDTHAGNTPPLFLWRDDTPDTDAALEAAVKEVKACMNRYALYPEVELVSGNTGIRSIVYKSDECIAIFLVNLDDEIAESTIIRTQSGDSNKVEIYADSKYSCSEDIDDGGVIDITLPDFRSSCIVKLYS